ncbi:MAG TPA: MarC family protein [Candidatus Binataceae bacterium]|nr:MarC family protein [Candidatus Binataceae bacterium]
MTLQSWNATIDAIASAFLLFYAGLFPIVNPVGGAPIFLGLTRHCSEQERNKLALRVTINSFFLLLGSMLIGSYVLDFFGITLPIVRVAGGLVVTATAWNLLQSDDEDEEPPSREKPIKPTDAFYPLTMPITVGPGTIAVAIALGSQRPRVADLLHTAILGGSALGGVFAMAATIYVCYRYAEGIVGGLGKDGTNVVVRLSAFILMCIGIEIIWNGYSALANIPH